MKHYINSIKHQKVKLAEIDLTDDTYRITTTDNSDDLMVSIKNVGVLNPPLLIENNSGFTIVCGFRRIETCRTLQWENVPSRILDSETQKLTCAKLAITDNAMQRPLNLIETSRAIKLFESCFEDDNRLFRELSALGLPENRGLIKKIRTLGHLSSHIHKAILSNTITLPMALRLGELEPAGANGFLALIETLKPSLNKQREILTLVEEIALREAIPIIEVLEEKRMREILNHADFDKNQKTRMIRQYLKKRRFPALTSAEKRFELLVKELKLGQDIKLIPPKNFEDKTYSLTLHFKNMIELKVRKETFDTIIQNSALEKILK
jgi:ParB family chromosome partitioning protein